MPIRVAGAVSNPTASAPGWPPAPPIPRSETDQQLIDAVELVKTTDNVRPLDKYGGVIKAVNACRRILDREEAARGPARYIDAYSTHVAERLTPGRLAR